MQGGVGMLRLGARYAGRGRPAAPLTLGLYDRTALALAGRGESLRLHPIARLAKWKWTLTST